MEAYIRNPLVAKLGNSTASVLMPFRSIITLPPGKLTLEFEELCFWSTINGVDKIYKKLLKYGP